MIECRGRGGRRGCGVWGVMYALYLIVNYRKAVVAQRLTVNQTVVGSIFSG